ncbi:barstar family protein [Herpetosiphon giganteus]|uniref:barstar family protein n=1 Tax=Herpetosiphon giganteus TaxID=2029754 RepID=UPI00195EC3F6|nr:barstar family protein [Herpetosiphon giganteus]MBM7846585.1 RNAse (barnase) inhibitor barstar [Herpetosiphon giganteus]
MLSGTIDQLNKLEPDWYFVPNIDDILVAQDSLKAFVNILTIDGASIRSENDFFDLAREKFNFPDYCRNSWDSFNDCFSDYALIDYPNYLTIIILINFDLNEPSIQELMVSIASSMLGSINTGEGPYWLYVFMPLEYELFPLVVERFISDMTIHPERILVKHRFTLLLDSNNQK